MTELSLPPTPAALVERFRAAGGPVVKHHGDFDTTGLDFLVVHVRDVDDVQWIVRAPRRLDVLEATSGEAAALALVAPCLPVAVPHWRVRDAAADRAVVAYVRLPGTPVMNMVDGAPGFAFDLQAPPTPFLDSFAALLRALHAIPLETARAAGLRVATDHGRAEMRRHLETTRAALAPSATTWAHWQRLIDDDELWSGPLTVAHGDLHPGHWLIDDTQTLTGVLDWTEAHVTSTALDLAMFFGCCGESALQALLSRIDVPGVSAHQLETQAKARWSLMPVAAAAWALRAGNESILAYTKAQVAALDAG